MKKLRVGIIGCGSIGSIVAQEVSSGKAGNAVISCLFDMDSKASESLASSCGSPAAKDLADLVRDSDIVVECASQEAVREYAPVIAGKRDIIILSVGALLDEKLRGRIVKNAEKGGKKVYVPSGAICGLDALKGAETGGIERVKLTTTKPAASLGISEGGKRVVFSGTPEEAVKKFPASINVSAAIRLSVGDAPVLVEVVADSDAKLNTHEISASGKFGWMNCKTENLPSRNPKTSALAAMSAVGLIKRLTQTLIVGT